MEDFYELAETGYRLGFFTIVLPVTELHFISIVIVRR